MSDTPLSRYLRLLRNQHNYTQDKVANFLGITRGTYSHYETARLIPTTEALYKLSSFYNVPLAKLVRLSLLGNKKESQDLSSVEYVISDEQIELEFDALYSDFLEECADMTPSDLNQWITIEDREIVYYYHQLSGHNKRLMNYFMKLSVLKEPNPEKKK